MYIYLPDHRCFESVVSLPPPAIPPFHPFVPRSVSLSFTESRFLTGFAKCDCDILRGGQSVTPSTFILTTWRWKFIIPNPYLNEDVSHDFYLYRKNLVVAAI